MSTDAGQLKQFLKDEGIDLVGVADASSLVLAGPPRPATDLMPTARSVIVMGVAHSLGAVYSPHIMLWTRNKMETSRLLDRTAEKTARMLEKEGALSLPISADKPVEIFRKDPATGKKLSHTKVLGFLSLKHAAVSCGLGQIGRSNLLLTPEFGPHQRLCGIVTEAPLEPDETVEHDLCIKGCTKCEKACPVGALSGGEYDVDPCFDYWSYGFDRMPSGIGSIPAYFSMLMKHMKRRDIMVEAGQTFITDVDHCIECMRACPVGERWKDIRPEKMRPMRSGGTE